MRFQWISQELITCQSSAHCFAQSFNHSLVSGVKIGHRNKSVSSESTWNPVESSRSKSTTCQGKGSLLRFWSNSTATPDGCVQKFGSNVWHDSELIATKFCSRKWNATFESHVLSCIDRMSFDFRFEYFLSNLLLKNDHLLCYWPIFYYSISKVCPEFKVLSSHFFDVIEQLEWAKNVCRENISTPIYVQCYNMNW